MAHRHLPAESRDLCYTGCVSPHRCDPVAHGGVVQVDRCACGAERRTNQNAGREESTGWYMPLGVEDVSRD